MPQFILDMGSPEGARTFGTLDSFARGYLEAAFFTETNEMYDSAEWESEQAQDDIREGRCGGDIPRDSSVAELAPESLASAIADCAAFQSANAELLELAYARDYEPEQAGRKFWFTRNGHGVGYWDRPQLDYRHAAETVESLKSRDTLGDKLSAAARNAGSRELYRGDDGQIYFS